jgi:hypothetical protein
MQKNKAPVEVMILDKVEKHLRIKAFGYRDRATFQCGIDNNVTPCATTRPSGC